MASITETFTGANDPFTIADNSWTGHGGTFSGVSNQLAKTAGNGDHVISCNTALDTEDQSATLVLTSAGAASFCGPGVRVDPATGDGYFVFGGGSHITIVKRVSGVATNLSGLDFSPYFYATDDALTLKAVGPTLTAYLNGSPVPGLSGNDTSISGNFHVGIYQFSSNASASVDNFSAQDEAPPDGVVIADGNWVSGSTWSNGVVPTTGAMGLIINNFNVERTSNLSIGDGSDALALSILGTGSLTLTGAKLTNRSNLGLGASGGSSSASKHDFLILQNNGSTPSGYVFDGDSGVTPKILLGAGSKPLVTGTSSGRAYIRTKSMAAGDASDSAGNDGQIISESGKPTAFEAHYCDLHKIDGLTTMSNAADFCHILQHCAVDSCGVFTPIMLAGSESAVLSIDTCVWTNTTGDHPISTVVSSEKSGGTREVLNCTFDKLCDVSDRANITFSGNLFLGALNASAGSTPWDGFDNNLMLFTDGVYRMGGDLTNSYFLSTGTGAMITEKHADSDVDDNVWGATHNGAEAFIGDSTHNDVPKHVTYRRNFVTLTPDGTQSSASVAFVAAYGTSEDTEQITHTFEHNTMPLKGDDTTTGLLAIVSGGGTFTEFAGMVDWFRSNIVARLGGSGAHWAVTHEVSESLANIALNSLNAANITHNALQSSGLAAVAHNAWSGVTGANNIGEGTPFNTPMNGTTAPNASGVSVADFGFVDITRTIYSWAVHKGCSGGASLADKLDYALALIATSPAVMIADLVSWVRGGAQPTAEALRNAAHDGGDIGAVDMAAGGGGQRVIGGGCGGRVIGD